MSNFFDSNVLLYSLEKGSVKQSRCEALLSTGGVVSVQVLNEFINAARRKLRLPLPQIIESLTLLKEGLDVVPLTEEVHRRAVEFALASNFHIYDCNIIAAAELAGCNVLYTEDMNHGQRIGRVSIRNPFI